MGVIGRYRGGIGRGQRTITTGLFLEVCDLSERWVLAAGAEEVAQGVDGDASGAALVEEGEGFFVVC